MKSPLFTVAAPFDVGVDDDIATTDVQSDVTGADVDGDAIRLSVRTGG